MVFVLLACTDIRGEKINVELPLDERPTSIGELQRTLEQVLQGEESAMKQVAAEKATRPSEPFTVSRLQRYEEDTQSWSDLRDTHSLCAYDQLYVFRKNPTRADISAQREVPAPRRSPYFRAPNAAAEAAADTESQRGIRRRSMGNNDSQSPPIMIRQMPSSAAEGGLRGGESGTSRGNAATTSPERRIERHGELPSGGALVPTVERAHSAVAGSRERVVQEQVDAVFGIGDQTQRGYLTVRDFQSIFHASQIRFPPDVVEDIHRFFAKDKRGEPIMSFQDFHAYARDFVQTISVAYSRLNNHERQRVVEQEWRATTTAVDELHAQKKALEERLGAVQRQLMREQEKKACLQNEADELRRAADPEQREEEQKLLDKEVSVFRYRQKLRQEEVDYERLAAELLLRRRAPSAAVGHSPTQNTSDRYGPRG
ncbi:calmodulin-like protein containing EF hand [Trypanosoma grayi]|uniref:calmodulin-like protein containing EF hand n=1 Tax=Trypanosoma grayi TaxID=71804 RepID=UPI0004F4A7EF|nr:calmodulin-like protein containing EF hand [Trypanosoma grayi]KEG13121.1 calmodulin-like protein containing EF hand [Trypanosoma grayi]